MDCRGWSQDCYSTGPEGMALVRAEYLRLRNEQEQNANKKPS